MEPEAARLALARRVGRIFEILDGTILALRGDLPRPAEHLLVFSRRGRGLCLSCGAKRATGERVAGLGGDPIDYDQARLDTEMSRLRRRVLEASGCEPPVHTVRGTGCVVSADSVFVP